MGAGGEGVTIAESSRSESIVGQQLHCLTISTNHSVALRRNQWNIIQSDKAISGVVRVIKVQQVAAGQVQRGKYRKNDKINGFEKCCLSGMRSSID